MVEAGETQIVPKEPAVVDARALVESVFAQVAAQQAPVVQSRYESEFQRAAEELSKDGKIDKDVAPTLLRLIEGMGKDLTHKQKEEAKAIAADTQTRAVESELGRMIERYARTSADPELVRDLAPTLKRKAYEAYNSDPTLTRRYQTTGEIDWDKFDSTIVGLIDKHVKSADKKSDKPAASGPAMKNSAPGGSSPGQAFDADDLGERQREIFNSQVGFAMKNMGLTREAAQERALKQITNAENKMKTSRKG